MGARKAKAGRDLLTINDLDQRTQAAKHAKAELEAMTADPVEWIAARRRENAVVSQTLLTSLRLRLQEGKVITPDERTLVQACTTVENTFNRTCEAILAQREAEPKAVDWSTYVKVKREAE